MVNLAIGYIQQSLGIVARLKKSDSDSLRLKLNDTIEQTQRYVSSEISGNPDESGTLVFEKLVTINKMISLKIKIDEIESELISVLEQVKNLKLGEQQTITFKAKNKSENLSDSITWPNTIKENMELDVAEMRKSLDADCFRAAIILCGRLLEGGLHYLYFTTTGVDLLEKSPGIGLGKLIAKLSDKNIPFEPGLTQQIHLINQSRIHAVHTKQTAFHPNKTQAEAISMYTLEALKKIMLLANKK